MRRNGRKRTFWYVRLTKTLISLRIRAVWSESSLFTWRNFASLTIQDAPSEESDPNLCCANMSEGTFSDVVAPFCNKVYRNPNFTVTVYRFRKIVGKSNFSEQFRKLINRYKRSGYSLDIMRQTACLVVNPNIVDGYASLFNCTTAVRASDTMTASS